MNGLNFDARGHEVVVGSLVAANISGYIGLGRVERITPTARYGRAGLMFHVTLLHKAAGQYPGHVSKIKDVRSLIVLEDLPA